jgi:hypothetical protein
MATARNFDDSMIETCLKAFNVRYLKDSDGDYVVQFAYSDDKKCELQLYLIRQGQKHEVLTARVSTDAQIPAAEMGAALYFCNSWNREKLWPKTYVVYNEGNDYGRIECDMCIDLEQGIHQELFDDFVRTCFSSATMFWKRVAEEKPFSFRR